MFYAQLNEEKIVIAVSELTFPDGEEIPSNLIEVDYLLETPEIFNNLSGKHWDGEQLITLDDQSSG